MSAMIDDAQIRRLWGHLTNQFNVVVTTIGTGLDENKQPQAIVGLDEATDDAIIQTLPSQFEGKNISYEKPSQILPQRDSSPI